MGSYVDEKGTQDCGLNVLLAWGPGAGNVFIKQVQSILSMAAAAAKAICGPANCSITVALARLYSVLIFYI